MSDKILVPSEHGLTFQANGQITGVANAIKENKITPEEAVRLANANIERLSALKNRRFTAQTLEQRKADFRADQVARELSFKNRQPFIFPDFSKNGDFFLGQGLTLVGARSGHSKSTTAANILAGFINFKPDTKVQVISNEENSDAILNRTACVLLKLPYMKYYEKKMSQKDREAVDNKALELIDRIAVIKSGNDWDTTYVEDVCAILEEAENNGFSMTVLDYYQSITRSRDLPDAEHFKILKMLNPFLRDYGRRSAIPVVVFAQLAPKSTSPDFSSRVQNDRTIYNDSFASIEIEPDFNSKLTTFTIHKMRFGNNTGEKVVLKFNQGWYEKVGGI